MSASHSPDARVATQPPRQHRFQVLESRWRKALRAASPSIGDSDWHWTDLKGPAQPRQETAPLRRRVSLSGPRGCVRPALDQPRWQA